MPAAGASTASTPSISLRVDQDGKHTIYTRQGQETHHLRGIGGPRGFCYSREMVKAEEMYDITVVGGGPVGLYAAYYAGLRECRTKLIEMYPELGGRLISMYTEKEVFDGAGHTRILARDLVAQLKEQAFQYRPTVVLNERVTGLRILGERVIELATPAGLHYSQTVIIAVGSGAFVPRKLDIPHLIDLEGHGIYYYLTAFEPLR